MEELAAVRRLLVGLVVRRGRCRRSRSTSSTRSRRGTSGRATRCTTARSSASRRAAGPRPGACRRGHLPGVAVPHRRALAHGRRRAHAAPARDGAGDRAPHGRHGVPGERPDEPRDQHPLRLVVPAEPVREVPQRAARARRVQRGSGQRRPLARQRPADRVRRDARLRRRGRVAEAHLQRGLARRAYAPDELDPVLELAENANTYTPLAATDERIVTDRWVLWMGRADHPAWNVAQRFRFRADELDEVRAEIHAALRARGRTGCSWEVGSSATPAISSTGCWRSASTSRATRSRSGWCSQSRRSRRRRRTSRCGGCRRRRTRSSWRRSRPSRSGWTCLVPAPVDPEGRSGISPTSTASPSRRRRPRSASTA